MQYINLAENSISYLDSKIFNNLSNLATLNLYNNKLKQIQINNLIQLQELQLENNEFESIIKVNSLELRILNLKSIK